MSLDRVKQSVAEVTYNGAKANFAPLVDWAFSLADGQLMSNLAGHFCWSQDCLCSCTMTS